MFKVIFGGKLQRSYQLARLRTTALDRRSAAEEQLRCIDTSESWGMRGLRFVFIHLGPPLDPRHTPVDRLLV